MPKLVRKTSLRLALALILVAVVITAVLLVSARLGSEQNPLTEAIQGGESAVTAVGRGRDSYASFVDDQRQTAGALLNAALEAQEYASARLMSASRTGDEFVLGMVINYMLLLDSSHIMTDGMTKLLSVSTDLDNALNYYRNRDYEKAAQSASLCLQTLAPIADRFTAINSSLDEINYQFMASGLRDKTKYAVVQYRDSAAIYLEYIDLLTMLQSSVNYSNAVEQIDEKFDELQHALANKQYDEAQKLRDEMAEKLRNLLDDPRYQQLASEAQKLNNGLLNGLAADVALNLKTRLKDEPAMEGFQKYLDSLQSYIDASQHIANNETELAEGDMTLGLSRLGSGEGLPADLKNYYDALRGAFNSLMMQIRDQPDEG